MTEKQLYECPHCRKYGLNPTNYGKDIVWECIKCGAELWYCESKEEMLERCTEIKERKND